MIGRFRAISALAICAGFSLPLIPVQMLAVRTGWPHPDRIPRLWHRTMLKLLGIRVRVSGAVSERRPLLLAANHVSWADIPVLTSTARLCFVGKSDMIDWPVFGLFAQLQRTVFVERERRNSSGRQASELGARLAEGDAMVLFAEGTTSDGNTVLAFKTTLFGAASTALASQAGKPGGFDSVYIQPVSIAYTRLHGMPMGRLHRPYAAWVGDEELAPHLWNVLKEGAIDVEVIFGEPVEFRPGTDRKAVAREIERSVREAMVRALRTPSKA